MQTDVYPQARSTDLVVQTHPGETLVYDLAIHEAHCLNEASAFIWNSCTGELTVDEIATVFEARFGQPAGRELIELALSQLNERRLLAEGTFVSNKMLNRREVIKRIGLASAVAIPAIASLTAPRDAFAVAANCVCTSPNQCRQLACPSTTNCNPLGLCAPN